MFRRISTIIALGSWLVMAAATSAIALPGEGYGGAPFGISTSPGSEATSSSAISTTGFDPTLATLLLAVVLVGILTAAAGYGLGTARHRRSLAH